MPAIKPRNIIILGSTGSVGQQTVQVVAENKTVFKTLLISGYTNVTKLKEQAYVLNPQYVAVLNPQHKHEAITAFKQANTKLVFSAEEIISLIEQLPLNLVVNAISGFGGLPFSVASLANSIHLALANKESMVAAGFQLKKLALENHCSIIPIDSELAALHQLTSTQKNNHIRNIYLTASGGPFRNWNKPDIEQATPEQALRHPVWNMGKKITIDSATMMNKAMEMIAAQWLFNLKTEQIKVLVHPQAIIHALVELKDSNTLALLAPTNMKQSIAYALFFPEKKQTTTTGLGFLLKKNINFEPVRTEIFESITLVNSVLEKKGNTAAALNAANERAVDAFLQKKISFFAIFETTKYVLQQNKYIENPTIAELLQTHETCTMMAQTYINQIEIQ